MTALKIPHDFRFYWHKSKHTTAHGPHWWQLKWWQVRTLRCVVGGCKRTHDTDERCWFYTRFGAFFIDWSWA